MQPTARLRAWPRSPRNFFMVVASPVGLTRCWLCSGLRLARRVARSQRGLPVTATQQREAICQVRYLCLWPPDGVGTFLRGFSECRSRGGWPLQGGCARDHRCSATGQRSHGCKSGRGQALVCGYLCIWRLQTCGYADAGVDGMCVAQEASMNRKGHKSGRNGKWKKWNPGRRNRRENCPQWKARRSATRRTRCRL